MTDPFLVEDREALEQKFDELQKRIKESKTHEDLSGAAMQVSALKEATLKLIAAMEERFVDGLFASRCLTTNPQPASSSSASSSQP